MKGNTKGKENTAGNTVSIRAIRSSIKKHYMSQFMKEMELGSMRKSSMAEIRREIQDEMRSSTIVRPLGPRLTGLGSQESLRSAQTYFVETKCDESELTVIQDNLRKQQDLCRAKTAWIARLEAWIARLEAQVATLTQQVATFTQQLATLSQQVGVLMKEKADSVYSFSDADRFNTVGMRMCIRTFMDHVVSLVYTAAGLSTKSDLDMANWLWSGEATTFFEAGHVVTIFDRKIALEPRFLGIVRGFKTDSSAISRNYAHSTKPVLVATVLRNLLFPESDGAAMLFKTLFQYSFIELTNKYEADLLTDDETKRLTKSFSSRS